MAPKEPGWQWSKAKELLRNDIMSGKVPLNKLTPVGGKVLSPADVWELYRSLPEFAEHADNKGKRLFPSRLQALRSQLEALNQRAATDSADLADFSFPNQRTIIEASHDGKGRKRSGF